MSVTGQVFLRSWVKDNIKDETYVILDGTDRRPAAYADLCQKAAETGGLTLESLGRAASDLEGAPNLEAFMVIAIDVAAQHRYAAVAAGETAAA